VGVLILTSVHCTQQPEAPQKRTPQKTNTTKNEHHKKRTPPKRTPQKRTPQKRTPQKTNTTTKHQVSQTFLLNIEKEKKKNRQIEK
jgi:hypothetical protein